MSQNFKKSKAPQTATKKVGNKRSIRYTQPKAKKTSAKSKEAFLKVQRKLSAKMNSKCEKKAIQKATRSGGALFMI